MEEVTIRRGKIRKKIQELRSYSALRPDGITPLLLKNLGNSILGLLEHIYKKIATGTELHLWPGKQLP
jgi:hypothetical protein